MKNLKFIILALATLTLTFTSCEKEMDPKAIAIVTTNEVANIQTTSATLEAEVTYNAGADITERGFVYSGTNITPAIDGSNVTKIISTLEPGKGEFSNDIMDLVIGTTYYVRAFATNSAGISYGEVVAFATSNTYGVFILNEGNFGMNNSNITLYDTDRKLASYNIFEQRNGKKLGNTGNDMLIYGSKMYIAVTASKMVFVTDLNGKIIKEVKHSSDKGELSPTKFAKFDGKVYVSYIEGYVGQIDTTSFEVKHTAAGATPEGIVATNNKIYIANSTGWGAPKSETISVIDIPTFTVSKTITVTENPRFLALADNGNIYIVSGGVYQVLAASLQKIDTATDAVTTISDIVPGKISMGKNNKLYILSGFGTTSTYKVLDTTNDVATKDFITDGTTVTNGYSISADPVTGNVYIGTSDYTNTGDIYVFSEEGKKIDMFGAGGVSPNGAFFISK